MGAHLIDGEFQSDKYPTCPRGKVPLSVKDKDAQDLLWVYAQRHIAQDPEFSGDLFAALEAAGYTPPDDEEAAPAKRPRPLPESSRLALQLVAKSGPAPEYHFNPGIRRRLREDGLVETVPLPLEGRVGDRKVVDHLRITPAGEELVKKLNFRIKDSG